MGKFSFKSDEKISFQRKGTHIFLTLFGQWKRKCGNTCPIPERSTCKCSNLQNIVMILFFLYIYQIPSVNCDDGEDDVERSLRSVSLSREWVAVLELPAGSSNSNPNPSHCQSVLDRVRISLFLEMLGIRDAKFLIFTNLNCQWKTFNFNQNWKDLASYCCFNNEDVVSAHSWQFTMWCHLISHFLILKRKPIWDCTGEVLLKSRNWYNRFSFYLDDIRSMHIHLFTPQYMYSILCIY